MNMANRDAYLEKQWVRFQLELAALRPALGPLYNAAVSGRRGHTFYPGTQPPTIGGRAIMSPTEGAPNGIPDLFGTLSAGAYSARVLSVSATSTILILYDAAIQEFARVLGQATGVKMDAGDYVGLSHSREPVRGSSFLWAAANNVRHVDEWFATAESYRNPITSADRERKERQDRSMKPLAAVLGVELPITENVAYEAFQHLTALDDASGSFDRLELHMLRIGQDLIHRCGLLSAPIGVSVTQIAPMAEVPSASVVISDGVARTASGLNDLGKHPNVRPLE